jgi:multiple sugar transport system substrate-binding protein
VTAAVQSGAGPDIIIIANNHPLLHETALVDVSDVAEELGTRQGGWYDYAKVNCVAGGRWIGVPQFIISWAITYREDWLQQEGLRYPQTWDEFRAAGRRLKARGQALRPSVRAQHQRPEQLVRSAGVDVGRHGGGAGWPHGRPQQQGHR